MATRHTSPPLQPHNMTRQHTQYDSNDGRRSPRDRSPVERSPRRYLDSRDSDTYRGAARGGERRRSPSNSRANTVSFNHNQNRELFSDRHIPSRDANRDSSLRDPPRGPRAGSKSYIDPPSGPRGNSFGDGYRGDFIYRGGRVRGRGRGSWRDESRDRDRDRDRDRGREMDRERDYRDMRRDNRGPLVPFRDERSRDREWGARDSFKGRRPSSPLGRGRSPNYNSRDTRDAPSSLDLDRARRGSRDGPMSVTSPSSESSQPFVHGYGRARGNAVGRGRGRPYYDEHYHRTQVRSRSPEPSFPRRTQPSATPPPQVPAFGSAGASASVSQSPVPGVTVPTAPRFHAGRGAPSNHYIPAKSIVTQSIGNPPSDSRSDTQAVAISEHKFEEAARVSEKRRQRKPLFGRRPPKIPIRDDYSDSDVDPFNDDDPEDEINFERELAEAQHNIDVAENRPDPPTGDQIHFLEPYKNIPLVAEDARDGSDAFLECVGPGGATSMAGVTLGSTISSEPELMVKYSPHSEHQPRPDAVPHPAQNMDSTDRKVLGEDSNPAVLPTPTSSALAREHDKSQLPNRHVQASDPATAAMISGAISSTAPAQYSTDVTDAIPKDPMVENGRSMEPTASPVTTSSRPTNAPEIVSSLPLGRSQSPLERESHTPIQPMDNRNHGSPHDTINRPNSEHSKEHSIIESISNTSQGDVSKDNAINYSEPIAMQSTPTEPTDRQSSKIELSLLPSADLGPGDSQNVTQSPTSLQSQLPGMDLSIPERAVHPLNDHSKNTSEPSREKETEGTHSQIPLPVSDEKPEVDTEDKKSKSEPNHNVVPSIDPIDTEILPDAHAPEDDSSISPRTKAPIQTSLPEATNGDHPMEDVVTGAYERDESMNLENVPQAPELTMEVPEESDDDEDEAEQAGFQLLRQKLVQQEAALEEDRQFKILESVKHPRDTKTPPPESLPVFDYKKWDKDEEFLSSLGPDPDTETTLTRFIEETMVRRWREQQEEGKSWSENYTNYRRFTDKDNDPIAVKSREVFAKAQDKEAEELVEKGKSATGSELRGEGQRRTGSRFATEHDFERVLRESEREAKESKEQKEQDAREQKANSKEATIPDMCWDEEYKEKMFVDTTHKIPFERSFRMLEFGESIDNFTEEEAQIFQDKYHHFAKQFSIIAQSLPHRDYQACIQHYYIVKTTDEWKAVFKSKKNQVKTGRRKGAKKSSALITNIENGGGNETEATPDVENGNERRRPRRAAAPTWNFETPAPPTDNEGASPAPTPAKKVATPKGDANGESAPTKRKTKAPREKAPKQPKASQLLAAAPSPANRNGESPNPPSSTIAPEPAPIRPPPPTRFPTQYDNTLSSHQQPTFSPAFMTPDRLTPSNLEVPSAPERVGSAPPTAAEPQPDRRSAVQQQTSSYWSVPEVTDFPGLLRHFGTDWNAIAKHMGTKTHTMVKNYYQRSVDSGSKREWETITRDADSRRERGETTGPAPAPSAPTKRRYDPTPAPLSRSASAMDLEELSATQTMILPQTSPPQSTLSTRFPALAQAGPVPQSLNQTITPTSLPSKRSHHQANQQSLSQIPQPQPQQPQPQQNLTQQLPPQQQQPTSAPPTTTITQLQSQPQQMQSQQVRQPRAPAMGFFTTDNPRAMMREALSQQSQNPSPIADSAATIASQRSARVAEEAEFERRKALEQEQKRMKQQQQQALQQQALQEQALQQQQAFQRRAEREQRDKEFREMENRANEQRREKEREIERQQLERNLKRKQDREQREQQDRREKQKRNFQLKQEEIEVRNPQQYEMYSAPSSRTGSMAPSRPEASYSTVPTMDVRRQAAPPAPHQQYAPRSQVHRTLLSDGMGAPQNMIQSPSPAFGRPPISTPPIQEQYSTPPPPPAAVTAIRQQDTPRKTSNIMSLLNDDSNEPSRAPPTSVQAQPKRGGSTTSVPAQSSRTPPPPPQHVSQTSRYSSHPSQALQQTQQIHQQMQQSQQVQQAPHQMSSQTNPQHGYSQSAPQSMHQHSSSVSRSYTPTPYEGRSHVPPPAVQHHPMYSQPSRQAIPSQPPSVRREPLNEMNAHSGYTRSPVTKLNESPYSATPPPAGQQMARQPMSSPHDLAPASDREIYNRQSQFAVPQQPNAAVDFHSAPQVTAGHRSIAFGQTGHRTPPTRGQWIPPHQVGHHVHTSRQNSFDGRNYNAVTSASAPAQQGYAHAPPPPHHMQYQQQQPQERFDHPYDREQRDPDRQERHDRGQYYRRGDDPRDPRDLRDPRDPRR
ncbi:hypothetical protein EYC84_001754 [Monilinia fructicola]|uniref:Myb-like domain-containing protein n=1 Tax=Monilinia fructicola TaxID=38448 RepID=A0A5M9JYJ2_MONFR|nr:hypothetical protein EYC84_001754 [Monilinia fructicola]